MYYEDGRLSIHEDNVGEIILCRDEPWRDVTHIDICGGDEETMTLSGAF